MSHPQTRRTGSSAPVPFLSVGSGTTFLGSITFISCFNLPEEMVISPSRESSLAFSVTLKLKDLVDVYLVDLKYMDNSLAFKYSKANNYVEMATQSIIQMRKNQPKDEIKNGLMEKGLIVRHLVLPSHTNDSIRCLEFIHNHIGKETIVSIMSQYEPRYNATKFEEINRKTAAEQAFAHEKLIVEVKTNI